MMYRAVGTKWLLVAMMVIGVLWALPASTQAYQTYGRWGQNSVDWYRVYQINSALNAKLPGGLAQSGIVSGIDAAANHWNIGSRVFLDRTTDASCNLDDPWQGYTCVDATNLNDPGLMTPATTNTIFSGNHQLVVATIVLHTQFVWHLNGGGEPDVFEVVLHEMGHVVGLWDHPGYTWGDNSHNATVMAYSGGKRALYIDDKEGATMMYGIQTAFETSEYLGLNQTVDWHAVEYIASSYSFANCSVGEPDYWTYGQNVDGIPTSPNGGRVMRFQGCTQPNGSAPNYAYMTLGNTYHDWVTAMCGNDCYMVVRNGMHLKWEQYNTPGMMCNVTIDLEFSDGTTLRDSGLVDNYYNYVHPALRPCFSGWRSLDVNLSSLANGNRRITQYLVAFDTPTGNGQWRSYFDNLRIEG